MLYNSIPIVRVLLTHSKHNIFVLCLEQIRKISTFRRRPMESVLYTRSYRLNAFNRINRRNPTSLSLYGKSIKYLNISENANSYETLTPNTFPSYPINVRLARCMTSIANDTGKDIKFDTNINSNKIMFNVEFEDEHISKETTIFASGLGTYFATYWKPKDTCKGLVFLCHGYSEYIGPNYEEMAQYLCKNGFVVFGHDHIGHGRSSGERVFVESMSEYVEPVLRHITAVGNWPEYENKPIFLVGHSMGGLISLFVLMKDQSLFSGFIGIAPLCEISPILVTSFRRRLLWVVKNVCPRLSIGKKSRDGIVSTRDEDVIAKNKADTLRWQGGYKLGFAKVMLESCEEIQQRLEEVHLPILVFQGTKDELVSPEAAHKIVLKSSSIDKEYIVYGEAKHALHIELKEVKEALFKRLKTWMENRI